MIQTIQLTPGVTLRCYPDNRFKKCAISLQLLRPMCREEAAKNALLPAVLLRGTEACPDLRSITWRLDELYGAGAHTMVRRVGEVQTVGFVMSMMEDRFALEPEGVLAPGVEFLRQLLLEPVQVAGAFDPDFVESEKRNLISAIESELNDKRSYASARMIRLMCQGDSFAVPRLGYAEDVAAETPKSLWAHYQKILRESPVEIFYVGAAKPETVAKLLMPLAECLGREVVEVTRKAPFVPQTEAGEHVEEMDINQGKLCMGFTTPITSDDPDYEAMRLLCSVYGSGMTSKLFMNVREKLSLCYYASAGYYGAKGILTVSSGIDEENYETAKAEILRQLDLCAQGEITQEELEAARSGILSGLRGVPDSPGALESYYAVGAISGNEMTPEEYAARLNRVTLEDLARCAKSLKLHTVYFLKGVGK